VFTARYALSPYIKQIRFVFKVLNLALKGIKLSACHSALHVAVGDRRLGGRHGQV
jgi:hypothetical protein